MRALKMPDLNVVMIAGNLTRDPELRYTQSGMAVASLCVANTKHYRTKANEKKEDTVFDWRLYCVDRKTGKILWDHRTDAATHWGSIVHAAGRLYATDQKGTTRVFRANAKKFELLARNELGEKTNSTLAISNGEIFLRTFQHLYCIGK